MRLPLRIGEQTILTNPETGEPVTVRVTAAEDGKVTVIVEAVPGSPVAKAREAQPEPPPRVIH